MAFDQATRNRLQRFVSDARTLLTKEFTRQLQEDYGITPNSGEVAAMETLTHLDNVRRETARILRVTLEHYRANSPGSSTTDLLERIVLEQAFTVLNRLAALRMAEAREFITESIASGYDSRGFQLYLRLAGTGLGETGDAYRSYLFSLFDEFALDLRVLFDRFSPMGRLFPNEPELLKLMKLMNALEIADLWAEDETIGWIYQYFNSKDERKKMRDESAAPRNSRELAVRNQFFTPRYVVEFLTDNTLGRIWYEMTQGETALKDHCRYLVRRLTEIFLQEGAAAPESPEAEENLNQEELLKQPVYIPHRSLKDPREIRMLDPACGSMHFGLYAFDLYESLYEEAWDLEERGVQFQRSTGREPLTKTYASKEAFLRDVPRLIIEHNIHGVDIDPRAVQIAGLSLWLRAQKSWQVQGLKLSDRPQIQKSNVVCAEPMPGEERLLNEFLEQHLAGTPEQQLVGRLVRRVFESMKLAGEAGSLLQIEQEISKDVEEAKRQWLNRPRSEQLMLSVLEAEPKQQELPLMIGEITDEYFWERVEGETYKALNRYAEQAENENSYQRRLFASDAVRGFSFIDLCRKKFDVVLMNPPFGLGVKENFSWLKEHYVDAYVDIYSSFITRSLELCNGRVGAITSRSFLITKKLERLRQKAILPKLVVLLDLGLSVMDAALVQACAFVLECANDRTSDSMVAFDRKSLLNQEQGLNKTIGFEDLKCTYVASRLQIAKLPQSKIIYSLPNKVISLINKAQKTGDVVFIAKQGMKTFNDFRFLRLRTEIDPSLIGFTKEWEPIAKGGPYALFYSDLPLLVRWSRNGDEIAEENKRANGQVAQARQASNYYRLAGGTYSRRSSKDFGVRILPSGCIIGEKGPAIIAIGQLSNEFNIGFLNSRFINTLVHLQANANQYDTGILERLPWLTIKQDAIETIDIASGEAIQALRRAYRFDEGQSIFTFLPLSDSLISTNKLWNSCLKTAKCVVENSLQQINHAVDTEYEVDSASLKNSLRLSDEDSDSDSEDEETDDENENASSELSSSEVVTSCLSYAVGCIFGRWDIRITINRELAPDLPDLSASFPLCPPGTLVNPDGLPANSGEIVSEKWLQVRPDANTLPTEGCIQNPIISDAEYPVQICWNGILVDDEGYPDDIIRHVRQVVKVIWGKKDSDIEQEACEILKISSLRDYFRKPAAFFNDHLSRYSKSRRQAPIYLPLSTASGSYTLWLYYHRLTDQTLYTCINDYVEPKLSRTSETVKFLRSKTSRTRDEENNLENLQSLEDELTKFRDELLRVAKLPWKPNLNDGVQITVAPLHSLFRLSKWQKKLKETWDKLEKGDYDWAHLAHSIRTAQVREKCRTDKSLAIAHGLEDLYEPPLETPKRTKRKKKES